MRVGEHATAIGSGFVTCTDVPYISFDHFRVGVGIALLM